MSQPLLASNFLFRFSMPCRRYAERWSAKGVDLDPAYRIPSFGELDQRPVFADLRVGWDVAGISFSVCVTGKSQTPWCRIARMEDSDGLQLWIDTRDTHSIHRASRFCHQFVFLPFGGGRSQDDPVTRLVPINRAREDPKPVADSALPALSRRLPDGYEMQGHIPAHAMTGYDPAEHPRLGFFYAAVDRELGWQTFSLGPGFPFTEDPSLWGTLELVEK
ncbi:MAG: hypothetical protein JJ992_19330 [Planctomycetes bacterium]|nr:hypothetical protein [Planctomycetota bacterium]